MGVVTKFRVKVIVPPAVRFWVEDGETLLKVASLGPPE